MNRAFAIRAIAALVLVCATAPFSAAQSQKRQLMMLDGLADGRWEIRFRGEPNRVERICLSDGRTLLQLRHPDQPCEKTVVEDSPSSVTVQYTCRGRGYGRTHIRRETNELVQLESQGIAAGLPFDFIAEGRRTGSCAG